MYKISHRQEGPWMGEFDNPQQALDNGRASRDVTKIWVGKMEKTYFSDMFIGGDLLLHGVPIGTQTLSVRFLGYQETRLEITVAPATTTDSRWMMALKSPWLAHQ